MVAGYQMASNRVKGGTAGTPQSRDDVSLGKAQRVPGAIPRMAGGGVRASRHPPAAVPDGAATVRTGSGAIRAGDQRTGRERRQAGGPAGGKRRKPRAAGRNGARAGPRPHRSAPSPCIHPAVAILALPTPSRGELECARFTP